LVDAVERERVARENHKRVALAWGDLKLQRGRKRTHRDELEFKIGETKAAVDLAVHHLNTALDATVKAAHEVAALAPSLIRSTTALQGYRHELQEGTSERAQEFANAALEDLADAAVTLAGEPKP
jgi:hypothetical protein